MDWPTEQLNRDLKRIGLAIVAGLVAVGAFFGWLFGVLVRRHRFESRSDHR